MSTPEVSPAVLEYKSFNLSFQGEYDLLRAVEGIDLTVKAGEIMGLVGESGCGKSVTSLSAMRLLPKTARFGGKILYRGKNILEMNAKDLESLRGNNIAMIFQEPMTALNPAFRIGDQIEEAIMTHQGLNKSEAFKEAVSMLEKVGMPAPEKRMLEYPHQLSGGMRQRVMIAIALSCKPELLIADEPTTALDVTIQAQILELIKDLQKEYGMAVLFITHDLGVVAEICDSVTVMYAGNIVESGSIDDIFDKPAHPYTKGLLASRVTLDTAVGKDLQTIAGSVPSITNWPKGCRFANRCTLADSTCKETPPSLKPVGEDHSPVVATDSLEKHIAACFHMDVKTPDPRSGSKSETTTEKEIKPEKVDKTSKKNLEDKRGAADD